MNYSDLGAKVKSKHSQYASMSDEEVGRRVSDKYPQYKSQITEQKSENSVLGSFASGIKKSIGEGLNQFGSSLGKAAQLVIGGTSQFEKQQQNAQAQADIGMKQAIRLRGEGKIKEAEMVEAANRRLLESSGSSAQSFSSEAAQGQKDVVQGGVKTGLLTLGAPAVTGGQLVGGSVFGGGLEAGRQAITGEGFDANKIAEAAGGGLGSATQAAGLTRFTNPLTSSIMSKTAGISSPIVQRGARALVGGLANTAEDVALSKATGSTSNIPVSFGIGALTGGLGKAPDVGTSVSDQMLNPTGAKQYGLGNISEMPADIASAPIGAAKTAGQAIKSASGMATKPFTSGAKKVTGLEAEDAYGRLATSLMKVDPGEYASDPQKYEDMARNFVKFTTKADTRESIKELALMSRNANQYIKDFAAKADASIGEMETASIMGEIRNGLLENPQVEQYARSYPDIFDDFMKTLESRLDNGSGGTTFSNINTARSWSNGAAKSYYKNGQVVTNDTPPQIESLFASALGKKLKDILVETTTGTEDGNKISKALDLQHTAIQVLPAVSEKEFLGQGLEPESISIGKTLGNILKPFKKRGTLAVLRGAEKLSADDKQFLNAMRNYVPQGVQPKLPSINPMGLPTDLELNQVPTIPAKKAGTALDMRGIKKTSSTAPQLAVNQDTSSKSKTTDIQARYAKESPKIGSGRRNISSEIVSRALETRGAAQKSRFLKDFPEAKKIESLPRKSQEKILSALRKRKYN